MNTDLKKSNSSTSLPVQSPSGGGSAHQDKFFITETMTSNNNQYNGTLMPIKESVDYYEHNYKKKSAFDFKDEIDEMKKTCKKLQFPQIPYNYYDNLPIKPGVFIYKALVESKVPLKQLKINIPETLCVFNGLNWITTNQTGKLEVKNNDFLPRNFYDKVREIQEQVYKSQWLDPTHAAVIDRKWQQFPITGTKSVQSWEKFNDTINYGPDSDSIIQQFIYSSAHKANTMRLFYYNPKAHPGQSQTFGYYMTNKLHYQENQLKYRPEERYAICSSRENSFEHFVMKGKVLEPYEAMADQLVSFIYKSFGVRIEQIAIDFTKDERDVIYFLDVNGFRVLEYERVSKLTLLSDEQWAEKVKEEKGIYDRANNTVQCQLCRISYKKSEVTKIVTFKMLFELKNHLYKRGIFGFEYLDKIQESTQSCKVCDICYMLVVAEHELIEVEKLYAISQNIPLEEKSRKNAELNRVDSENIRGKLNQWRLLFYMHEFQDIQLQLLKSKCTTGKLYLQIKLFDFYTTLEIDNIITNSIIESSQQNSNQKDGSPAKKFGLTRISSAGNFTDLSKGLQRRTTIKYLQTQTIKNASYSNGAPKTPKVLLKKLRTYFFFVDEVKNLKHFLENTEVEFRITDGPKWNKPIAFASAYPFTHFSTKNAENKEYVQRQNILLHFFGADIEPFYLLATTGLKKDKEIKTEKMFLYHYNSVYFPDNTYYNSDPLPIEWLELFESRDYFLEKFNKEEDENINLGFTPFCSIKELNYLEPDFKGRWNVRQEAIITGYSDTRAIVDQCTERLYPKNQYSARSYRSQSQSMIGHNQDRSSRVSSPQIYESNRNGLKKPANKDLIEKVDEESLMESQQFGTDPDKSPFNSNQDNQLNFNHERKQSAELNESSDSDQILAAGDKQPVSKDQLRLQLDKLGKKLHQSQSLRDFNIVKNPSDFKIRTTKQLFNVKGTNGNYTQALLQNARQLINLQQPEKKTKKRKKSKAAPLPNEMIFLQPSTRSRERAVKNRPFSAKNGYSLMTTLGDNIIDIRQQNKLEHSEEIVNQNNSQQLVNITSPTAYNTQQKRSILQQDDNVIAEDFKEDEDNFVTYEQQQQLQQQPIEMAKQRPRSNYTQQNSRSAMGRRNKKYLQENINNLNGGYQQQLQQENNENQDTKVHSQQKSLKRPASAAFLHNKQLMANPQTQISMKYLFQIYERLPSGSQLLNGKKEKKNKKSKKRIKLKQQSESQKDLQQQQNYLYRMASYDQQQQNYQTPMTNVIYSPDSVSFQLSNTQVNSSAKIIADHRILKNMNQQDYIKNPLRNAPSTESTQFTYSRLSQMSQQPKFIGVGPQSSNQGAKPNQYFSEILNSQQISSVKNLQPQQNSIVVESYPGSTIINNFSPIQHDGKSADLKQQSVETNNTESGDRKYQNVNQHDNRNAGVQDENDSQKLNQSSQIPSSIPTENPSASKLAESDKISSYQNLESMNHLTQTQAL